MRKMFNEEKKQYAEDCKNYERPWELWEYKAIACDTWKPLRSKPIWHADCIYRRKQTFVHEYFSGLNWRDAEHLIGKTVECTDNPDTGWKVGTLKELCDFDVISRFGIVRNGHYVYIRTCEKTDQHQTINIGGVELPKPETVAPEPGTVFWIFGPPAKVNAVSMYDSAVWPHDVSKWDKEYLNSGSIHLTEERAKAWSDWWKSMVIDKMK